MNSNHTTRASELDRAKKLKKINDFYYSLDQKSRDKFCIWVRNLDTSEDYIAYRKKLRKKR